MAKKRKPYAPQIYNHHEARMHIALGDIFMKDDSNLQKYLLEWQEYHKLPDCTDIVILPHADFMELARDAMLSRNWGA